MAEDYERNEVIITIWRTFPPVFILVGTFGNTLTIAVLTKRKNRHSPTALFLVCVAVSDLIALWTGLLRQWIIYMFDYDMRTSSNVVCKLSTFVVYFSTQCSSWFMVALTVERCLSVMVPHRVKQLCRFQICLTICSVIAGCLVLVNIHWFVTIGLDEEHKCLCYSAHTHASMLLLDLFMFSLIPALILIIGNALIIVRVLVRRRRARFRISPAYTNGTAAALRIATIDGLGIAPVAKHDKSAKFSQMTLTLITLSIFFLVSSLPIAIMPVVRNTTFEYDDAIWAITNLLMYLNNTLNFVFYFLCGSRFANDVKRMIIGNRFQVNNENGSYRRS